MRRAAVLAGLGGVLAIVGVWRCVGSRSSTSDGDTAEVSPALPNGPKHVDPKVLATISGKVVAEDGAAIARARVCASGRLEWDDTPICTVADEAGAYTIRGLVPARYLVSA